MNKLSQALVAGALTAALSGCANIKEFVGEKTGANTTAQTDLQGNTKVEFGTLVGAMKGQLSATRQGVLIIRGDVSDAATGADVLDAAAVEAYKGSKVVLVGNASDIENDLVDALGADNVQVIPSTWDAEQTEEARIEATKAAGTELMKVVSGSEDGAKIIAIVPQNMGDLRNDGLPETLKARNVDVEIIDVISGQDYAAEMAAGAGMFTAYTATHEVSTSVYDPAEGTAHYTQGTAESTKKVIDTLKDPAPEAPEEAPEPAPGQ